MKKYNVSFTIQGEWIHNDTKLTKDNLMMAIIQMDQKTSSYYGNREIDCVISNLTIKKAS